MEILLLWMSLLAIVPMNVVWGWVASRTESGLDEGHLDTASPLG